MPETSSLTPESTEPHDPWGDGLDEQAWGEIAEKLQAESEATHIPEADSIETNIRRPIDPRLNIQLKDHTLRWLSDYSKGNVSSNTKNVHSDKESTPAVPVSPRIPGWWNQKQVGALQKQLSERIFTEVLPREQFIVGQAEKGVRIFNFGEPLSVERQNDCERFVDIITQYMGDHAYDLVSDVIIANFSGDAQAEKKGNQGFTGFADTGNGLLLVNAAIMHDEVPADVTAEGSLFLQTLIHESGHLIHGNIQRDPQARKELEGFAEAIGWNMEAMRENSHDWLAKNADNRVAKDAENRPYAPHHARPNLISMPSGGTHGVRH